MESDYSPPTYKPPTLAATQPTASLSAVATTSTTYVMAGLGLTFKPLSTGIVRVTFSLVVQGNTGAGANAKFAAAWGTGGAPTQGVAASGTVFGQPTQIYTTAGGKQQTTLDFVLTVGILTPGTTYWFDLQYATANASDSVQLQSGTCVIQELSQ